MANNWSLITTDLGLGTTGNWEYRNYREQGRQELQETGNIGTMGAKDLQKLVKGTLDWGLGGLGTIGIRENWWSMITWNL